MQRQKPRLRRAGRFLRSTLFVGLAVAILWSAGCLYPPKSYENPQLREQYEKEFVSRELDPIEGFWRSENEYAEGTGVIYRIDPAENLGFPFASRGFAGRTKVALPLRIDEEDFLRIGARMKPTSEPGVYRGEMLMIRGKQKFWEDMTVRIIDPTTLETTVHASYPVLGGSTQRSYLFGPKHVLEARLQAATQIAKRREEKHDQEAEEPDGRPASARSGSGFYVSGSLVVTNYHVVEDTADIRGFVKGSPIPLTLLARDLRNDLALLRSEQALAKSARFFLIGDSSKVRHGQTVYTMGYPLPDVLGHDLHVHDGIISSLTGILGSSSEFQVEMTVNPGISGGPLVDNRGAVIGVVTSKLGLGYAIQTGSMPEGVTFAVKADSIRPLAASAGVADQLSFASGEEAHMPLEETASGYGEAVVRIEAEQ